MMKTLLAIGRVATLVSLTASSILAILRLIVGVAGGPVCNRERRAYIIPVIACVFCFVMYYLVFAMGGC